MTTGLSYRLSTSGQKYLGHPARNSKGRISTGYFKNVILIFIFMTGHYEPARFKAFMELFDVFARPDRDRMPTRPYVEWKHYVDAAKQQLLNSRTLVNDGNGRFKIVDERADEVFKQIAGYLEAGGD